MTKRKKAKTKSNVKPQVDQLVASAFRKAIPSNELVPNTQQTIVTNVEQEIRKLFPTPGDPPPLES